MRTKENYYTWRSQVLTHMDASHPETAEHILKMERAKIEEVQRGDFELPRVRDKALWSLFYNAWIPDKSGLEKSTR